MKRLLIFFCLAWLQQQAQTNQQRFIIFLHNKFIEDQGLTGVHPEYGRAEYKEIVQAFRNKGFMVIGDVRPKDTDGNFYASKVVRQVDSLLKSGVKPSHITLVGTSKGGYIAAAAAGLLKNAELNVVVIGYCPDKGQAAGPEATPYGQLLYIYEKSDAAAQSCATFKNRPAALGSRFKELELNTGLKHGFLFKPLKEWLEPTVQWALQAN